MTTELLDGGNVIAWCSKCKLELDHTIIKLVEGVPKRVQCSTCSAKHIFRMKPKARGAKKSKQLDYDLYMSRATSKELSRAKKYSMEGNFEAEELVDHHAFGVGIILTVIHSKKIEILFKDGPKLMVQNQ